MKKILLVVSIITISSYSQNTFSELAGTYLGQTPPGEMPEIFAPELLSTGSHELDITITPDGKEIFFTRSGSDWFSMVLQFKLTDNKWIGPMMSPFSGRYQNNYPFVTPDGQKILYNSQEPVNSTQGKNNNIFVSTKLADGWDGGTLLYSTLNVNGTEMYISVAANGNIYFGARYEEGFGGCDLYYSEYLNGRYGKATNLGKSINSEHNEFHCYISPDEDYLLFDSQRPDGFGANDLYICYKLPDGSWREAVNLGNSINTEYSESRPYVSPDGKYLFFCSNRLINKPENYDKMMTYKEFQDRIEGPGNGFQDIYWVDASFVEKLNQ